uniref:Uncharacterized protein n=1 Tax=Anguilla anguilla TaxID=7936 RepID=A0A0E9W157_ANGAN
MRNVNLNVICREAVIG